jgi:hypothetical protein
MVMLGMLMHLIIWHCIRMRMLTAACRTVTVVTMANTILWFWQ